ncbi:MAG: regulatory protein TetR [Variovorax sp.]|nr:regulatory protein TetR [Variovorax sp.]
MVDALVGAPASATAIGAIAAALDASTVFLGDNRAFARQRSAVIAGTAELHERELIKLATLSAALAKGLRGRGIPEPDASLAAEAGIAVFRVAFALWVGKSERRSLSEIMRTSLGRLKVLAGGK